MHIEATDNQSGVAAVQVNGTLYTELSDGKLKIWLKEYADAYEQLIVQAVDKVGNVSQAIAVANPFYKNTGTTTPVPTKAPTSTPKPNTTPKPTAKPTATPKATATPKPTKKDSGGGMLGIIGILAAAGGGAFWYLKIRKPSGGKSKSSFEDYDFEDDDDEDDEPLENEGE